METKHITVKINDIESNPYIDRKRLPLKNEKVEILRSSIQDTSFWENILLRPHPEKAGKFQAAYGHHRLAALKAEKVVSAIFIVADLPNEQMVKVMSNENMQEYTTSLDTLTETLIQVRNFLNDCLVNGKLPNVKNLYPNVDTLKRAEKSKRVGVDAIHRFLGTGWSRATIARVLKTVDAVKDKKVNSNAVRKFQSPKLAEDFVKKMIADKVKVADQSKVADKILSTENGQSISELLRPRVTANTKKVDGLKKTVKATPVESDLETVYKSLLIVNKRMNGIIKGYKGHPNVKVKQFENVAMRFVHYCEELNLVKTEKILIRKKSA